MPTRPLTNDDTRALREQLMSYFNTEAGAWQRAALEQVLFGRGEVELVYKEERRLKVWTERNPPKQEKLP